MAAVQSTPSRVGREDNQKIDKNLFKELHFDNRVAQTIQLPAVGNDEPICFHHQ